MKQRPALLKSNETRSQYRIEMRLQEGRTAEFIYSDRHMAREHFDHLRTVGVVGGVAIRHIEFMETNLGSK